MPVYSYVCKDCGHKFDLLTGVISEKPKFKCEKCGSSDVKKLLPRFISGKTEEGAVIGGNSCSTCQASSCTSCGR